MSLITSFLSSELLVVMGDDGVRDMRWAIPIAPVMAAAWRNFTASWWLTLPFHISRDIDLSSWKGRTREDCQTVRKILFFAQGTRKPPLPSSSALMGVGCVLYVWNSHRGDCDDCWFLRCYAMYSDGVYRRFRRPCLLMMKASSLRCILGIRK